MTPNITNFSVVLTDNNENVPVGGAELKSGFFATAKSSSEVQPDVIIDNQFGGNDYIVQCEMTKVVHGKMSKDGLRAMLAVFEFVFLPRGATRRFLEAEIEISFSEGQLASIAPNGMYATLKSETEREVTHSVNPSVEVGIDPVKTALGYTWELKETSCIGDYATLTGARLHKKSTALWGLSENTKTASGLPSLLRMAVLLERRGNPRPMGVPDTFNATVQIRGKVDKLVDINGKWELVKRNLSGRRRVGEMVNFDTAVHRGKVKDLDNMQNEDLTAYSGLVTVKTWEESEQATSPSGQTQPSSTTGVHPGTVKVGNPKPIHGSPETNHPREFESISTSMMSPCSPTVAVNDPLHKTLPTLVLDNSMTPQALHASACDSFSPLGLQPSIAATIISPVADMPDDDYKHTAKDTGILEQPRTGRPMTQDLPGGQTSDDNIATLQQQLMSVRFEARLVQRLLNLVEQERILLGEINKSENRRLGSG